MLSLSFESALVAGMVACCVDRLCADSEYFRAAIATAAARHRPSLEDVQFAHPELTTAHSSSFHITLYRYTLQNLGLSYEKLYN